MSLAVHVVIPDTQVKPGVATDHLEWAGRYIVDQFAGRPDVVVIHLGDHADLPSLSSWDKGKRAAEGRRYVADIDAANAAWGRLNGPFVDYNRGRRKKWTPRRIITLGNHEDRITRAANDEAFLDGALTLDHLDYARTGWEVVDYLRPVIVDGVAYCHMFVNPMTGKPYGGQSIDTRLRTVGCSFTMGHQQQLLYGIRYVLGRPHHGLVAGSFYLHDEDYRGPQGNNAHWRGIVVCHEVQDGSYDVMAVSLNFLCRRYTGRPVDEWKGGNSE